MTAPAPQDVMDTILSLRVGSFRWINIFYRELIYSSFYDMKHGDNKALLKYMQCFAELCVF